MRAKKLSAAEMKKMRAQKVRDVARWRVGYIDGVRAAARAIERGSDVQCRDCIVRQLLAEADSLERA